MKDSKKICGNCGIPKSEHGEGDLTCNDYNDDVFTSKPSLNVLIHWVSKNKNLLKALVTEWKNANGHQKPITPGKLRTANCGCGCGSQMNYKGGGNWERACSDCGMSGPVGHGQREATLAWNFGICGKSEPK